MSGQIICVDGKFSGKQLELFNQFNISLPQENSIYNIRRIVKGVVGKPGLLLEEIQNPEIPLKSPLGFITHAEPNWKISRFSYLNGDPIEESEVREFNRNEQKVKEFVKLDKDKIYENN